LLVLKKVKTVIMSSSVAVKVFAAAVLMMNMIAMVNAFTFQQQRQPHTGRPKNVVIVSPKQQSTRRVLLWMADEAASAPADGENGATEEGAEDGTADKKPAEDPEVTSLKEQIAELESALSSKKLQLEKALDQCEEYSKTGYARKVAEMENMRRVRSVRISTFCFFWV
jgi:hypothetical protein